MAATSLLPQNATPLERALSLTNDEHERLAPNVELMRGVKLNNPPPTFLPFIAYEYGLGPISPYFTDPRLLLSEGVVWERKRGTGAAVEQALGWISAVADDIEAFPTRRRRWNLFMLALAALPANEEPLLAQIEDLAGLSVAIRSKFWRGFKTYDVRALEWARNRYSAQRWGSYSGARLHDGGAKWSFGRTYELVHQMTQAELTALGVWLPPGGAPLQWGAFSWDAADAPWSASSDTTRRHLMISGMLDRPLWIRFKNGTTVIGARRAKVVKPVIDDFSGPYAIAGQNYRVEASDPSAIYAEFLTEFGDGFGAAATSWELLWDAAPLDTTKPGLAWAGPTALSAGTAAVATTQAISFRRTIRERFRILLTI